MARKKKRSSSKRTKLVKVCAMVRVPVGAKKTTRRKKTSSYRSRPKKAGSRSRKRRTTHRGSRHGGFLTQHGLSKSPGAYAFKRDMLRDWWDDSRGHRKAALKGIRRRKARKGKRAGARRRARRDY